MILPDTKGFGPEDSTRWTVSMAYKFTAIFLGF